MRGYLQEKELNFKLESNSKNKIKIYNNFPGILTTDFIKDELIVIMDEECITGINNHLSSDKNRELGGVITGYNCELVSGEKFVYAKNFIKAEFINSSLSRLTFTPETWQQINDELENKFPDEIILGWYHSHPGHSVFLSEYDLFIQKNFFNLYFNFAYVFDPVLNQNGFFIWKNDDIVKTKNYSIINNQLSEKNKYETQQVKTENNLENKNISETKKQNKNYFLFLIVFINLAVTGFLLFQITKMKNDINLISSQVAEYESLRRDHNALNQKLEDYIIEKDLSSSYIEYSPKQGETIRGISYAFLNDSNRYEEILKLNNLQNENEISGLTKIKIPMNK